MIITNLLTVLLNFLTSFLSAINIPGLDDSLVSNIYYVFDLFLDNSETIIGLFLPWNLVKFLLLIVIAIIFAEDLYRFVMWVLRKIPFLGIE